MKMYACEFIVVKNGKILNPFYILLDNNLTVVIL